MLLVGVAEVRVPSKLWRSRRSLIKRPGISAAHWLLTVTVFRVLGEAMMWMVGCVGGCRRERELPGLGQLQVEKG